MPHDQRGTTARVWQAIMDKVANAFGQSDAYIDKNETFYKKFARGLETGEKKLPDAYKWCEALALIHVSELVKSDLKDCLEKRETFRIEAKNAFKQVAK